MPARGKYAATLLEHGRWFVTRLPRHSPLIDVEANSHTATYCSDLLPEARFSHSVVFATCTKDISLHSVSRHFPDERLGAALAVALRTFTVIAAVDFDLPLPADDYSL